LSQDPVGTIVNTIQLLKWSRDILVRGKGALKRINNGVENLEIVLAEVEVIISIVEVIEDESHLKSDVVIKAMTLLLHKAKVFHSKLESLETESNKSTNKALKFVQNFIKDGKDEKEIAKLTADLDSTKLTLVFALVASPAGVIRNADQKEVIVDVIVLNKANERVNKLFEQYPHLKRTSGVGPDLRMVALI